MSVVTSKRLQSGHHRLFLDGREVGEAWKFPTRSGFGLSLNGYFWRNGAPQKTSGMSAVRVNRLKDAIGLAQQVLCPQ